MRIAVAATALRRGATWGTRRATRGSTKP